MGIYIPPQGDITVNESAIKNTDAEMRDGVWADSTKADGANISYIYGNTSTLIKNTSLILVMGSNDATLPNQSIITQYNQTIDAVVDAVKIVIDALPDNGYLTSLGTMLNQSYLLKESSHLSYVFPENSSDVITMHTGAANAYGPYNVIKDGSNNTFCSKFNNTVGHISSMLVEETSVADLTYIYEISYGAGHTTLTTYRFHSVTNQVGAVMKPDIDPPLIPAGEILYYRGMAENASVNAEISFRYHFHS